MSKREKKEVIMVWINLKDFGRNSSQSLVNMDLVGRIKCTTSGSMQHNIEFVSVAPEDFIEIEYDSEEKRNKYFQKLQDLLVSK